MNCPVCVDVTLQMSVRQGVEIDYCPRCRGIWLDRGELDKIIERSEQPYETQERETYTSSRPYDDDDHYQHGYPHKKKRKSFLGDMFDIFD